MRRAARFGSPIASRDKIAFRRAGIADVKTLGSIHYSIEARRRRTGRRVAVVPIVLLLVMQSASALAHGDTIRVSYKGVRPARLVVVAGTTVHFHNANASGAPCTVVVRGGEAQSPPLGRAEGWHHTFEEPGEYPFHVGEYPSRKGVVVVTPAPE